MVQALELIRPGNIVPLIGKCVSWFWWRWTRQRWANLSPLVFAGGRLECESCWARLLHLPVSMGQRWEQTEQVQVATPASESWTGQAAASDDEGQD